MAGPGIIDLLNEIELRFPVDRWRLYNVQFWPLVRIMLAWSLRESASRAERQGKSFLERIASVLLLLWNALRYFRALVRDRVHNASLNEPVDAVFLGNGVSRYRLNGAYYDTLCDPFIDILSSRGMKAIHLEPDHYYIIPRFRPSVFISFQLVFAKLLNALQFNRPEGSADDTSEYGDFLLFLRERGISCELFSLKAMRRRVSLLVGVAAYFEGLLRRLSPRIAFVVGYPALEGLAFCRACRNLRIPSVVIQHGVQGEYNEPYARWARLPDNGFELLPTVFWCWTEDDAEKINAWSACVSPVHTGIAGGNLFLRQWVEGTNQIFASLSDEFVRLKKGHPGELHILVSLQYGFSSPKDLRILYETIVQAPREWVWWLRLHPLMKSERTDVEQALAELNLQNYEMNESSSLPLYAALRNVDVHVTLHSAVVIDAQAFCVPSVILSENGRAYFREQIRKKAAVVALSAEEALRAITVFGRSDQASDRDQGIAGMKADQGVDELFLLAKRVQVCLTGGMK